LPDSSPGGLKTLIKIPNSEKKIPSFINQSGTCTRIGRRKELNMFLGKGRDILGMPQRIPVRISWKAETQNPKTTYQQRQ
jgi:hypothetical protein